MRTVCVAVDMRPSIASAEANCTEKTEPPPSRIFFRDLCEFLWPVKTAWVLAERTGATLRMARYWLAGRHEVPAIALRAVFSEILIRLD